MTVVLIILIIAVDQLVKYLVRANFTVGETLPVIPDIFHITYVQNRGAAFSMFQNMSVVTVLLPIALVILCAAALWYCRRKGERMLSIALAMIIAGGIGNLIDRIGAGFVTDMFDFQVFPVFNVADISVTVGCVLAVVCVIFAEKGE